MPTSTRFTFAPESDRFSLVFFPKQDVFSASIGGRSDPKHGRLIVRVAFKTNFKQWRLNKDFSIFGCGSKWSPISSPLWLRSETEKRLLRWWTAYKCFKFRSFVTGMEDFQALLLEIMTLQENCLILRFRKFDLTSCKICRGQGEEANSFTALPDVCF